MASPKKYPTHGDALRAGSAQDAITVSSTSTSQDSNSRHPASLYRLRVAGVVPNGWEDRLGCLRVVHEEGSGPQTTTTLMGAVTDQADLLGILNTLHELRLALLLVEAMDTESIGSLSENKEPTKPTQTK